MSLTQEEAKKEAEYELRFNIGNLPHLGDPTYDEEEKQYIFPIKYTKPKLPKTTNEEIEFFEAKQIGEMIVESDGSITRTSNEKLNQNIKELNEAAENGELQLR